MKKILIFFICTFYMNATEYRYKEIDKSSIVKNNSSISGIRSGGSKISIRGRGSKSEPYKNTLISKVLKNGEKVVSTTEQYLACMSGCLVKRTFEVYDKSGALKFSKKFGDKRVVAIKEIAGGYRLYLDDNKLNRYIEYKTYYYQIDVDENMEQINIDTTTEPFFRSFIESNYEDFVKGFTPIDYDNKLYNHHNLMYYVVQSDDVKKVKFLEKQAYKMDKNALNSAFNRCIQSKESKYRIEVLNYLETKGLNILTETFFSHLVESNQIEIAKYMIEKREMKIGSAMLIGSIVDKNREIFDYLIDKGANRELNCSATVLQKDMNKKQRRVSSMIVKPEFEMDYYLKNIDLFDAHLSIKKVDKKYEVFVVENKSKKEHRYSFSKRVTKVRKKETFRRHGLGVTRE